MFKSNLVKILISYQIHRLSELFFFTAAILPGENLFFETNSKPKISLIVQTLPSHDHQEWCRMGAFRFHNFCPAEYLMHGKSSDGCCRF